VFAGKAGAYSSETLSGPPLKDRLLALLANSRLGCKGLPRANTPAYYENS